MFTASQTAGMIDSSPASTFASLLRTIASAAAETPRLFFEPLFRLLPKKIGFQKNPSAVKQNISARTLDIRVCDEMSEDVRTYLQKLLELHGGRIAISVSGTKLVLRYESISDAQVARMVIEADTATWRESISDPLKASRDIQHAKNIYRDIANIRYGKSRSSSLGDAGRVAQRVFERVFFGDQTRPPTCLT